MTTFVFYVSLFAETLQLAASIAGLYTSKAIKNQRLYEEMKAKGLIR